MLGLVRALQDDDTVAADLAMTKTLAHSLALIDVHVLDHFIVAGSRTLTFAERGLL